MSTRARVGTLAGAVLVLGGLLVLAEYGSAGDDEKAIQAAVLKIAAAVEKNDTAAAKKDAAALAKKVSEIDEVMNVFKLRKKKGLGVGQKAGAVTPDGIEQKLIVLGRDAPPQAQLDREAASLEKMAYVAAAVAEFALAKPPEKDMGKKTRKEWTHLSTEMRQASVQLAEAVKTKNSTSVRLAADKLNTTCNTCHSIFK